MGAAFGSSGERCMALSVAVAVGDAAADLLVSKMAVAMKTIWGIVAFFNVQTLQSCSSPCNNLQQTSAF